MKILIDARFYGLENAGLGRYTANLINNLQIQDKENQYFILLKKKYFDELNFSSNFEKVLADIPHYSVKEQIEIPKIIKNYNPDIVHFLHFNTPVNYKGKFVVTIHDMTMHNQKTNASNLLLPIYIAKRFAYKHVFKNAVINSSKIIVPSEAVKDDLVKNFTIKPNKVSVIYEGVTGLNIKATNNYSIDEDLLGQLYFLYVGNAYPHKNLEKTIKAVVELNRELNHKVSFYIVSKENKFVNRLKKLANKLNSQNLIKFLGYVDDESLRLLYEKSVGFIYPSLSEGFGLQGLEAMNAGTILISSNISTFKEIYGNHALYFDPTDIESMIKALRRSLSLTQTEASKLIKENKEFIKRYSWEGMAKETIEVYEECYN